MGKIVALFLMMGCIMSYGEVIALPKAKMTGGMPLMEALSRRTSSRDFNADAGLTRQELSELLWSANGFNRGDKRTAPSAVNAQAIDIYVFDAAGVWLYHAKENTLEQIASGDKREMTGMQPFVKKASVNFVYVYDKTKWPIKGGTDGRLASTDAAFCAENVYLYCASFGLKTVVRGSFPEKELRAFLNLPENKIIALAQSIGK